MNRPDTREQGDIIAALRTLMPASAAVTWSEARSIAERQATRLLRLHHITAPAVPQFVVSSLPGIVVDRRPDWPTSGMAVHTATHWRIVLCANEPQQRQRFSLAHELKHVLDEPFLATAFRRFPEEDRHALAERLCNIFAACLLMPRTWVKHDWCGGTQSIPTLARRYGVSPEAMTVRLAELGLTEAPARAEVGRAALMEARP